MPDLDRFSHPMSWEWLDAKRRAIKQEIWKIEEPTLCACGCGEEIFLDDDDSYVISEFWADEFIINEPEHLTKYLQVEKDQPVGSQS